MSDNEGPEENTRQAVIQAALERVLRQHAEALDGLKDM